jgi:hypothetical protein
MSLLKPRNVVLLLSIAIACVYAQGHASSIASMSLPEIEDKLQVSRDNTRCAFFNSPLKIVPVPFHSALKIID